MELASSTSRRANMLIRYHQEEESVINVQHGRSEWDKIWVENDNLYWDLWCKNSVSSSSLRRCFLMNSHHPCSFSTATLRWQPSSLCTTMTVCSSASLLFDLGQWDEWCMVYLIVALFPQFVQEEKEAWRMKPWSQHLYVVLHSSYMQLSHQILFQS